MATLQNDNEKLQFLQSMTNSEQASRREYRWRNAIIPPNPKTQRQIDVRNRFAQDHHGISLIVGDDQVLVPFGCNYLIHFLRVLLIMINYWQYLMHISISAWDMLQE